MQDHILVLFAIKKQVFRIDLLKFVFHPENAVFVVADIAVVSAHIFCKCWDCIYMMIGDNRMVIGAYSVITVCLLTCVSGLNVF